MAKTGLSYYQAETDRFQDIKVKRLKKRYGCEGYAVYQYIQNEIYRVEGCYIRFTDDQLFDVSEYWGIEEQRVEKIIEYCTEVELFDTITWHTNHVLTSVDIQQRYLEICRRVSLSPDGNRGNVSAESCGKRPEHGEEYRLKLQRLGETCYNLGCSKGDVRKVLMIENIAMDDSPIWQLIEELKASGGRYSFTGEVLPALWGLVKTGRLRMMEEHTDEVKEGVHNVRQMLSGIGVPSYDMDELCGEAKGKEDVLQEVIREIRRSKGRILSVSCFIRSRLKKAKKNELQKTA